MTIAPPMSTGLFVEPITEEQILAVEYDQAFGRIRDLKCPNCTGAVYAEICDVNPEYSLLGEVCKDCGWSRWDSHGIEHAAG